MESEQIAEKIQGDADLQPMEMRTAHLKLELHDVWGGDGNVRFQLMKKKTLEKTEKRTRTKSTMQDYSGETERGMVVEVEKNTPINTFEERDGTPILYFGRKLYGVMKQVGVNLARMENSLFSSIAFCKDMMTMVSVTPEIVVLAGKNWRENDNYYLGNSGQTMSGRSTFIPLYFDAFKRFETEADVRYPACYDKQVRTMINLLRSMKAGNRRMMKIIVVDREIA